MALKTFPKILIILAITGGIGYAVNGYLKSRPPEPTAVTEVPRQSTPAVVVPEHSTQVIAPKPEAKEEANSAVQQANEAARRAHTEPAKPTLKPDNSVSNGGKGLDALLRAGGNKQ
jgi:hypothetical protein